MFDPDLWIKERASMRRLAKMRIASLKEAKNRLGNAAQDAIVPDASQGVSPADTVAVSDLLTEIDRSAASLDLINQELAQIDAQIQEGHRTIDALESARHQREQLERQLDELRRILREKKIARLWILLVMACAAMIAVAFFYFRNGGS